MSTNDDRLRVAYKTGLEQRASASRGAHPEPEALVALVERSGSEAVRLEILDHVMSCDPCRRELDLVRAGLGAVGLQRQRTWFRSPSVGLMALAATLLLVAGVRLYVAAQDAESGPRLRGGSAITVHPVRWLPSVGAGLAWRPTDGADSYRLEVVDESGTAVVDSILRDTSFVLADSLVRGHRGISWLVTATLGDGSTVTSLPTRLIPPAR